MKIEYVAVTPQEFEEAMHKLVRYMKKEHLLQADVARGLGVTPSAICAWFKGRGRVGPRVYRRIVTYLVDRGAWE